MRNSGHSFWNFSSFILPFAVVGALVGCTGKDTSTTKDSSHGSGDSSSNDTDTGGDTDTDSQLATYADYEAAQARALCQLWDTCGVLATNGYTDVASCVADVTAHLDATPCDNYDQYSAKACIRAEMTMAADCTTYDPKPPQACQTVCGAPSDSGAPPPAARHTHRWHPPLLP